MTVSPMCVIGIGAQKAGTTTVSRELKRHPDFAFSGIKELHYFDSRHIPRLAVYRSEKFKGLLASGTNPRSGKKVSEERLKLLGLRVELGEGKLDYVERFAREFDLPRFRCFGEVTPAYALLPRAGFEEIRDTHPDTKLIFIMRDPMDRVLSHARFEVTRGARTQPEVENGFMLDHRCIDRSQYADTIGQVLDVFSPESVFFGFFEDLVSDMPGFFRNLYDFLDLDYLAPVPERHENPSARIEFSVPEREIFERLRPTYEFVAGRWPDTMPKRWYQRMQDFA